MTPFECYVRLLALKAHFAGKFDFFKYNGKVRASVAKFEKSADARFYEKIAANPDPEELMLSGVLVNSRIYVRDVVRDPLVAAYHDARLGRVQSLSYLVDKELDALGTSLTDALVPVSGRHPLILREYLAERLSLETMAAVATTVDATRAWKRSLDPHDPVLAAAILLTRRYEPFIRYDRSAMRDKIMRRLRASVPDNDT